MLKSKVIRFITEKDTFERYIIRRIRLIWAKCVRHNRSISDDVERGMLAKLKVECGLQSTVKLEGIFYDMLLSAIAMQAYRDH